MWITRLDFLSRHKDRPCYVEVWPDDTHTPWVPDLKRQGEKTSWDRGRISATCSPRMMSRWGELFDGINKLGLEQNTLVIFTSDNGPLPSFNHERTGGLRAKAESL